LCFCQDIPQIRNVTDVLILQHVGERYHAFNTARVVQLALERCQLIVDHNRRFGQRALPIQPDAGLLYLDPTAPELTRLSAADRPRQIIIVDGTWHQAKTIVRDVPQLAALPRFRLAPTQPGQYRIRREPDLQSLSTLEATVYALQALEPETIGLEQLLTAFHRMVDKQLGQMSERALRQLAPGPRPRFVPHLFRTGSDPLVVAYGEATPRVVGQPVSRPRPVSWCARRLGTQDSFACYLESSQSLPDFVRAHLRIPLRSDVPPRSDVPTLTDEEFRAAWQQFLQPRDNLIVFHEKTCGLLDSIGAIRPRSLAIKAVFRAWRRDFRTMEELLVAEEIAIPEQLDATRAEHRLAMTLRLTEHLRSLAQ
jgi:DTW domain-containing protein YfiP